jgi:hypothetical protein
LKEFINIPLVITGQANKAEASLEVFAKSGCGCVGRYINAAFVDFGICALVSNTQILVLSGDS